MDDLIHQYVKDRNCALLKYPDTSGYDELENIYGEGLLKCTKGIWEKLTSEQKLELMETIIFSWSEAPLWLKEKVRQAQEARKT